MKMTPRWYELLEYARFTPSPHNVQPWKIKVTGIDTATLYIDTTRTLPKEDITGAFLLSAMSMWLEALSILCANRSLHLDYTLCDTIDSFPQRFNRSTHPSYLPFSNLTLSSDEAACVKYPDALLMSRQTSRVPYDQKFVSEHVLTVLAELSAEWNQQFLSITAPSTITRLMVWNADALFKDLNVADYHDEIAEYFRYSDRMSHAHRDGLDFRCMNVSRVELWLSAYTPWLLKTPGIRRFLLNRYFRQFGNISHMGAFSGPFWDPDAAFAAGRFLLRFWLELSRYDFYMHPFGNLVTNPCAAKQTANELSAKNIWFVFRMGHSKIPARSQRLSVKELLLD